MEIEALRKQLSEEIQSQFDAKLRDAKRQKSLIEEEYEQASEKWRTERRRLNAEIDRLETALQESKQSVRDTAGSKSGVSDDDEEDSGAFGAADERMREAAQSWESERTRLQAEISRLQEGIAEAIERSNNPLRANQGERGKLESKYEEAVRAKRSAENALAAAKSEWEAEKIRLVDEAAQLRRPPSQTSLSAKVDEQLGRRLQEAVKSRDGLAADLEKAKQEISKLNEAHAAELQNLKARLENARKDLEGQLRESESFRTKLEKALEEAEHKSTRADGALSGEVARLNQELEKVRQENKRLEAQHVEARSSAGSTQLEISKLNEARTSELQELKSRLESSRKEFEKQLRESEDSRARLEQTIAETEKKSAPASGAISGDVARLNQELEKAKQESKRLEGQLAEARNMAGSLVSSSVVDDLRQKHEQQMQEMVRENVQLMEKVKTAAASLEAANASPARPNGHDAKSGSAGLPDAAFMDAEVARVGNLITEIAKIIDDPDTELSTVIRKNVERAELDAYLRGILFSRGTGKAF